MSKCIVTVLLCAPLLAFAADDPDPKPAPTDWGALGFGLGIGVEQYRNDYVDEASTNGTNRIVNIDKQYNTNPSAWLTISWSFPSGKADGAGEKKKSILGNFQTSKTDWGLFAGIKLVGGGDNKAFNAFAIGPQVTFRTGTTAAPRDISLGLGAVTHKTRGLANGITEGKPLPTDYTDVKYREKSEWSWMLMLSVAL